MHTWCSRKDRIKVGPMMGVSSWPQVSKYQCERPLTNSVASSERKNPTGITQSMLRVVKLYAMYTNQNSNVRNTERVCERVSLHGEEHTYMEKETS